MCVAKLPGDQVGIVPVTGWEIEKEEVRDRRKGGGGADVANRERTTADPAIFIRGAGKEGLRPHRVYIRTLDGGQEEQKDRDSYHFTIRSCVHRSQIHAKRYHT